MSERRISALALSTLLLARFSHARGSSSAIRSGGIDHFPFLQSWANDHGNTVSILCNVLWCHNDDVNCLTDSEKVHINLFGKPSTINAATLDNKEIDVAVHPHLAPCLRPKQDNFLGMCDLNDTTHNLVQVLLINPSFLTHLLPPQLKSPNPLEDVYRRIIK